MGCGGHTNLCGCGWCWSALTEGLENLSTEVFRTRNRAAGAGLVARCLHGTIGLRSGHSLATSGF